MTQGFPHTIYVINTVLIFNIFQTETPDVTMDATVNSINKVKVKYNICIDN